MMTMFHAYRDGEALVVSEDGVTFEVPGELLSVAGLRELRTGQRLVLDLDTAGAAIAVRLP
ncbi:MAG: hypothetical protein ACR2JS_08220 [Candidatus Nanopelagicales bacterium]